MKVLLLLLLCLPPAFGDENEDLAKEVAQIHEELKGAVAQIQQKTSSLQEGGLGQIQLKMMGLASDATFLQALQDLWNHPNRTTLLIADAIFLFLMFLLKSWRQSKATNWFKKAVVGLGFSVITWFGVIFLLPFIILGDPFRVVVLTLWKVFTG